MTPVRQLKTQDNNLNSKGKGGQFRFGNGGSTWCGLSNEIEELEPSIKDKLLFLANAIIRDAKTGKAYS
jgi:hypothetical protein